MPGKNPRDVRLIPQARLILIRSALNPCNSSARLGFDFPSMYNAFFSELLASISLRRSSHVRKLALGPQVLDSAGFVGSSCLRHVNGTAVRVAGLLSSPGRGEP